MLGFKDAGEKKNILTSCIERARGESREKRWCCDM
jgi:hypothetical protein